MSEISAIELKSRMQQILGDGYRLIDSGMDAKNQGWKLEKIGNSLIARPSSLSIWKKRQSDKVWGKADFIFHPESGWNSPNKKSNEWVADFNGMQLKMRLQSNGQVGIFPEHACYLAKVQEFIGSIKEGGKQAQVLSLFAYTGMASVVCLKAGAEVCHVDSSKKVLEYAKENAALNGFSNGLRLIPDDALSFLKREVRRGNKYDLVLLDPPSFSRLEGKKSWKLEEVIFEFAEAAISLLRPTNSRLIFTCHHQALDSRVLSNILDGYSSKELQIIEAIDQGVMEETSHRILPAGTAVMMALNAS